MLRQRGKKTGENKDQLEIECQVNIEITPVYLTCNLCGLLADYICPLRHGYLVQVVISIRMLPLSSLNFSLHSLTKTII